jgi:hypothetical protein
MSRIKSRRQGINNMLVFENQDNQTGTITFNGSVFTFSVPTTFAGAQTLLPAGTAAAPSLAFSSEPATGMYRYASNVIGFSTAGNMRAIITAGGVLQVGTILSIDGVGHTITGDRKGISEAVTTAPLTTADSGKVFFINNDTTTATYTLPTAAAGLYFKWIWTADCDAAIIIETSDHTNTTGEMIVGGLLFCAAAAVNTFVEAGADANTITLDNNVNEVRGGAGSWIELIATEAKTWNLTGVVNGNVDGTDIGNAIITNAA